MLRAFERQHLHEPEQAVLRGDVAGLVRRGDQAVHGGDREKAAVAGLAERLPGVAGEQERARQQHREQRVPALLGELLDRRDVLEARARDDGVEAAEALERGVDGGPVARRRREIGLERLARPVRIRVQVDGQHRGAVRFQPCRDRAADAAARTRDESPALHVRDVNACGSGVLARRRQDQDRPAVRRRPAPRPSTSASGSGAGSGPPRASSGRRPSASPSGGAS